MSIDWIARVWREFHCGNLTRAFRDVLLTLRTFRGHGGAIFPSHQTLADRVGCDVRTVARALKHAKNLGLVSWIERRVRRGWRWLRTSNRYCLTVPDGPAEPGNPPVWWRRTTTGHYGSGGESLEKKEAPEGGRAAALAAMVREAEGLPDLLAMRRAAMVRVLLGKGAS